MAEEITAGQLKERLDRGDDFLLVDVLPPSSYLLIHLPTAINIPLPYLHEVLEYLPQDKDLIVYCSNADCEYGETAAKKLELHGFTHVLHFRGGMEAWEKAGYAFETILLPATVSHHHHERESAEKSRG